MITGVIITLLVILLALFIDWQAILNRHERKRPVNRAATRTKKNVPNEVVNASTYVAALVPDERIAAVPDPEPVPSYVGDPEMEKLLSEADIHFRKGELKAAEEYYLKAAAKDPRCSKAYSRLGVIYLENGDSWEDAEAAFRQALKSEPENGFILNNLGLVLYHQDKYADAIRHFEAAVRQDDLNAARHANLGMGYMAIRQYAKAESAFKKALKLEPNELEYKDLLNESIEKKKAHKTMVRK